MKGKLVIVWAILLLVPSVRAFGAPGDLDPDFGTDGIVTLEMDNARLFGGAVAVQPDGKAVVVGYYEDFDAWDMDSMVARLNTDGTLDDGFGSNGFFINVDPYAYAIAKDVTIQPDGKILVLSSADVGKGEIRLARYDPDDGSLDPTFGTDGQVLASITSGCEMMVDMDLGPDGRIALAGWTYGPPYGDSIVGVMRFLPDGSLDSSFDADGIATTDLGSAQGEASAVAFQPDGRIIAAGYWGLDASVLRYDDDGSLDPSFGEDGVALVTLGDLIRWRSLVLQPDGKIVLAGHTFVTGSNWEDCDFAIARYNPDGSLDPSFGTSGIATASLWDAHCGPVSTALQADGRIVIATENTGDFALLRFNTDGTLDDTFGLGGMVTTAATEDGDTARGVAIAPDGKIIVSGTSEYPTHNTAGYRMIVARYLSAVGESVTMQAVAGGTVTTDTEDDGATATDTMETSVTTPNAGTVSITETSVEGPAPSGFSLLGEQVEITAPVAAVEDPLALLFQLDASLIPSGQDETTVQVFRDGVEVDACAGSPGTASPDPCVSTRATLPDGDVEISVLTSEASLWTLGVLTAGPIHAPLDPVAIDTPVTVSAPYHLPGSTGALKAVWDWGDGTTSEVPTTGLSGTVTGSHTYTSPDVHIITLTLADDSGVIGSSVFQYLVVFDPNGGFVSGGGWILSEPGWCQLDGVCAGAEGKANFGFISKYKAGAQVPTGNTEFNFSAGNLNFHSSAYDWLVVTGSDYAKFKGTGTINGGQAPNDQDYKFMLWAGDKDPDTFRIKIWWEEGETERVVYDNGMDQEIGGGSIVVHAK